MKDSTVNVRSAGKARAWVKCQGRSSMSAVQLKGAKIPGHMASPSYDIELRKATFLFPQPVALGYKNSEVRPSEGHPPSQGRRGPLCGISSQVNLLFATEVLRSPSPSSGFVVQYMHHDAPAHIMVHLLHSCKAATSTETRNLSMGPMASDLSIPWMTWIILRQ